MPVTIRDLRVEPMDVSEINEFFPNVNNTQRLDGLVDYAFFQITNRNTTDTWRNPFLRVVSQTTSQDTSVEVWGTLTRPTGEFYQESTFPAEGEFRDWGNIVGLDLGVERRNLTGFNQPVDGPAVSNGHRNGPLLYINGQYYVSPAGTSITSIHRLDGTGRIDFSAGTPPAAVSLNDAEWWGGRLYTFSGFGDALIRRFAPNADFTEFTEEANFDSGAQGGSATKLLAVNDEAVYTGDFNTIRRFDNFQGPAVASIEGRDMLRAAGITGTANVLGGLAAGGIIIFMLFYTASGQSQRTGVFTCANDLTGITHLGDITRANPVNQQLDNITFKDDNTLGLYYTNQSTSDTTIREMSLLPAVSLRPGRPQELPDLPPGQTLYVWVKRNVSPNALTFAADRCEISVVGE